MTATDFIYPPPISDEEQSLAKTTVAAILRSGQFRLEADGTSYIVPSSAVEQIVSVLNLTADSMPAEVIPALPELTVAQAAKFLKMSERHLNDLLDEDIIVSRRDGANRTILRDALLTYLENRERRQAILDDMTREAQEMGLYD